MRVGIGLPNTMEGVSGRTLLEWARRAEKSGFAFVSTVQRMAYPSYDSLTSLAAVAGATSKIGLVTNVVLGPTYADAVLAKIVATVASVSDGRLTLGVGVGSRRSDYATSERPFDRRGQALDRQLEYLRRAGRGEPTARGDIEGQHWPVAPTVPHVPVLVGGSSDAAVRRTVQWGDGWTGAGGAPHALEPVVERVLKAWRSAGRSGRPRLLGLAYFGADPRRREESYAYVRNYYAFAGAEVARANADAAVLTPEQTRAVVQHFADIGMDELTFAPTLPDLEEVDRLADLVL